jgi:hypothetical protein
VIEDAALDGLRRIAVAAGLLEPDANGSKGAKA